MHTTSFARILVAVCGLALSAPILLAPAVAMAQTPVARAADVRETLPIRRIVLYRSGVGAFERRGMIDGNADIQLRFATDQVNDILKSMFVLDKGGSVDSIRYGSKDPLSKRLASFGIDISDNPDIRQLLERLRGSAVRITTPDGLVGGTILGTEMRKESAGKDQPPIDVPYVTLVTPAGIKAVNLRSISSITFDDESLNAELNKALAALAEHRADRTKSVDVTFRGTGAREAIVGYIHEMPVWKTSYRLILPEAPPSKAGGAPSATDATMQGWAIVENTTDEDWTNVALGLVSGRPVSFRMDLYEPLYVFRPEIPVPTVPGVMPRAYEGGQVTLEMQAGQTFEGRTSAGVAGANNRRDAALKRSLGKNPMDAAGKPGDRSVANYALAEPSSAPVTGDDLQSYAARAQAQAVESGEVFQYQLENPVTIERQKSAMIPILSAPVQSRRVSIYNRNDGARNPMRGVELTNSTNLQLIPGPISVYDGAAYAGDAQIGHVGAGDKRLLAYSVDLEVDAQLKEDQASELRKVRIVNGAFEQTVKQRHTTAYTFANKDKQRPRTLILEQPKLMNWGLVEPAKPTEKTEGLYRFELNIDSAKQAEFKVVQEHVDYQTVGLTDLDFKWLVEQSRNGKVSGAVIDAVKEAARRRQLVTDAAQKIQRLAAERAEIDKDQNRIRENMKTVGQQASVYARYLQKFTEQENRVEAIDADVKTTQADQQRLEAELAEYLRTLNVE